MKLKIEYHRKYWINIEILYVYHFGAYHLIWMLFINSFLPLTADWNHFFLCSSVTKSWYKMSSHKYKIKSHKKEIHFIKIINQHQSNIFFPFHFNVVCKEIENVILHKNEIAEKEMAKNANNSNKIKKMKFSWTNSQKIIYDYILNEVKKEENGGIFTRIPSSKYIKKLHIPEMVLKIFFT